VLTLHRKKMPAAVLQHRAGQWWNLSSVPPIVYTISASLSIFRVACLTLCYYLSQRPHFLALFPAHFFHGLPRSSLSIHQMSISPLRCRSMVGPALNLDRLST
jgi:hypothetical protein